MVVGDIRRSDGFSACFENAILRSSLAASGRRGWNCHGLAFENFTDDSLLPRGSDGVGRSADVDELRETHRRATVKMAHKAKRTEWPDKERGVRNRVRHAGVREWRYQRKLSIE